MRALDRLLDLLSMLLNGQHYKPLGAPTSILRSDSGSMDVITADVSSLYASKISDRLTISKGMAVQKTPELMTLALVTLRDFDFSGTFYETVLGSYSQNSDSRTHTQRVRT